MFKCSFVTWDDNAPLKTIDYLTETPKSNHRKILFDFFDQGAPRNSLRQHGFLSLSLISSQNLRIRS